METRVLCRGYTKPLEELEYEFIYLKECGRRETLLVLI
jgi:hypothetical protein